MVRCKFTCFSITKTQHWDQSKGYLYTAEFSAVGDGSPENEKFFEATPSGRLTLGAYRDDLFEVGKAYYIDLTPAD